MKIKMLLAFVFFVIITAIIFAFTSARKTARFSTPISGTTAAPTKVASNALAKFKQYKDPSGFTFQYPDNVTVESEETSDQSIYSSLKLTAKKVQGNISIKVTSAQLKNIDEWFAKNKLNLAKDAVKKLKLAELDARQFEKDNKLTTLAIDVGTLFIIQVDQQNDKNFWPGVNKKLISSFAFQPPEASSNASSEFSGDDVVFEGEEVVE